MLRADLRLVPAAAELGAAAVARIRLNYAFALGYNLLMLPSAAGLLYPLTHVALPPSVAGLAMALSSTSVVASSLLLKRFAPAALAPPYPGPDDPDPAPGDGGEAAAPAAPGAGGGGARRLVSAVRWGLTGRAAPRAAGRYVPLREVTVAGAGPL
jgi:hypothetical protein